jgi:hypothetical protein
LYRFKNILNENLLCYFIVLSKPLLILYVHLRFEWVYIKRAEAVALLKELGEAELIQPSFVLLEIRSPDIYQLRIRGSYDLQEIKRYLKNRFKIEEYEKYLVILTL